jgi:hypothetical protein
LQGPNNIVNQPAKVDARPSVMSPTQETNPCAAGARPCGLASPIAAWHAHGIGNECIFRYIYEKGFVELTMLKKLFKRDKDVAHPSSPALVPGGSVQTTSPAVPPVTQAEEAATPAVAAPRATVSDAVWVERRRIPRELPVAQVIEGTGGDTDWNLWNGANNPSAKH